ncbi:hypothetical protein HOP52_07200 [Halomonas campisalis]|uniref:Uncharacterized protein n=1 Tax=Billgrantia campisalis TaxID=74661 RepID=A0ABS9P8K4_9GAMM|nr:hypothetical protein [Halomonas campisalis]
MSESQLEQLCLAWFADNGWEIAHGPDLAPDGDARELLRGEVVQSLGAGLAQGVRTCDDYTAYHPPAVS